MRYHHEKTNWGISLLFSLIYSFGYSQSYSEGFEDLTNLTDWYIQNNTASPDREWGASDPSIFPAQAGSSGSYLSVNYESTLSSSPTTISNWLFSPTRTYNNGDAITFYTRTAASSLYPDRMEVRFSGDGNGLNCGTTPTDLGTFTKLLLTINPMLNTSDYPQVWTQYTITISGLTGPTNGRIAFRYFVTDAGPGGNNSNYIGLDSYTYSSVASPPSNDQCSGATALTQGSSCNPTSGTVAYATESQVGCSGTANNDVWYSFVATSAEAAITINGSPFFDAVYEVFSGNCSILTSLSCKDSGTEGQMESGVVNNLAVGQTYYIRVYDWLDDIPNTMNFGICVEQFTQCNLQQPSGSLLESESCGADLNGGCNSTPVAYQQITCGETIFGSAWAENGNRDLDWYRFQLSSSSNVTFSASAEFPYFLYIVDISNCTLPVILASGNYNACEPGSISFNAALPGNYAVVISPSTYTGYSCASGNNSYIVNLDLPTIPVQVTSSVASFCQSDSVLISASINANFNWFLNGSQIGVGPSWQATQEGTYSATYLDLNSCLSGSNSLILNNLSLDDASFSYSSNTVCLGSSNLVPLSTLPGTYSSDALGLVFVDSISGEIDMTQSTEGSYLISFTTDSICPNSSTQNFEVTSSPNTSFHYLDSIFCISSSNPQPTFNSGASIGIFSATSNLISIISSSGEIDLAQSESGVYTVYNTIPASGLCQESVDSVTITIQGTQIVFPQINTLCPTDQLVQLQATPLGGSFSGTSVTDNQFNTALGSCEVTYFYSDSTGCSNSSTQTVLVDTIPSLSFGQYNTICSNDAPIDLSLGLPVGGFYTGSGTQNNQFNPNLGIIGTNNLNYIYTTQNGCSDSISGVINVTQTPNVTFDPLPNLCDTSVVVILGGVSPSGGTFTGVGVSGSTFSPDLAGVGSHQIAYTFTSNGCSSSAFQTVTVDNCSDLNELDLDWMVYPNPSDGNFILLGENISFVNCLSQDGKILTYEMKSIGEDKLQLLLMEPPGTYFIQIMKSGRLLFYPLVVN